MTSTYTNRLTYWLALLVLVAALPATGYATVYKRTEGKQLDNIVAIVNESVIVRSELDSRMQDLILQLRASNTPMPPVSAMEQQVLERLVVEELQLQLAETTGVHVDDEMLNQSVKRLAEANNLTITQLRDTLEKDGLTYAQFREQMRTEITLRQLRHRQIDNRVTVTEREIERELVRQARLGDDSEAEYLLYHILLAVPEAAAAEDLRAARKRTDEVLASLREGANFQETAIAVSQGQNALEGGSLGWRKLSEIPSLFVDIVADMSPGDIGGPIRSPSGFHIIQLAEARGEEQRMIVQTHARHILLHTDQMNSSAKVQQRLLQIRNRLLAGEDFEVLARGHSQDRGSASKGGDLGWSSPGDLVPAFEEALAQLQLNDISKPFETRYGWHIAQVLERRDYDNTEDFKRSQAREQLRKRKIEEETGLWLRRLRDEAYVELRL